MDSNDDRQDDCKDDNDDSLYHFLLNLKRFLPPLHVNDTVIYFIFHIFSPNSCSTSFYVEAVEGGMKSQLKLPPGKQSFSFNTSLPFKSSTDHLLWWDFDFCAASDEKAFLWHRHPLRGNLVTEIQSQRQEREATLMTQGMKEREEKGREQKWGRMKRGEKLGLR